jgi:D-arabinose 1-dehydrogenase-like Zn-dependent alcohol dehydrogenase
MPLEQVAPILCAGITVYKGLKESGAKPGQTVAIVGAGGGLGSLAQQYAKAMGLQVVAIDTGAEKRDMCLNKLGASAFVDFKESKDVVADVRAAANNGEGPQYVFLEYYPRLCLKTELLTRKNLVRLFSSLLAKSHSIRLRNMFGRGGLSLQLACQLMRT